MPVLLPVSRAVGFFPLPVIKDSCNISIVFWFTLWTSNISMIFIMTFGNEKGEYTGIRKIPFEFKMWLMEFLRKWNNRGLLREGAGQEVKNALKIRCREEKIREVELPQGCAKRRHKQMPVVAMFCFLNQPDHRTSSVTDPCESQSQRLWRTSPLPALCAINSNTHPVLGKPVGSTGSPWRSDTNKQGRLLSQYWVRKHVEFQLWPFSCLAPCLETSPSNLPWIPAKWKGGSLCIGDFQCRKPLAESLLLLCGMGGHAPLLMVVHTGGTWKTTALSQVVTPHQGCKQRNSMWHELVKGWEMFPLFVSWQDVNLQNVVDILSLFSVRVCM